jgi:hypothetical protein
VLHKLATHEAVLKLEENVYGYGEEAIVDKVDVGHNIVVPCESEIGKELWLILCDKAKHNVTETFTDQYNNTYYEGDEVICGCWYDILRLGSLTYYFNDDAQPAYVYSNLVCATKFIMPPTSHNVRGNYATFEPPNDHFSIDRIGT